MKIESIEKKAQEVRDEYAYMDSMPLEGWFWEIIRRGSEYKKYYQDLWHGDWGPENEDEFRSLGEKIEKLGLGPLGDLFDQPKPETRYCDLDDWQRPPVHCKTVLTFSSHDFFIEMICSSDESGKVDEEEVYYRLNRLFETYAIGSTTDTLYLAVSKNAPIKQIEEEIGEILKTHVHSRKTKLRASDKWKFYLIAYDLKQQSFSFGQIAVILSEAYPTPKNEPYDERTIQNYYKNALSLIDGEYKKYLFLAK